jgi:imidazole glycerol-phosphate synthase subunit HisF
MKSKLKTRLIPILLYRDGLIVKSRQFKLFQTIGNPFAQVERYNKWDLDELIYLNISKNKKIFYDSDNQTTSSIGSGIKILPKNKINVFEFVKLLSKNCFMPLTYGGGIDSVEVARKILKSGADKICINSYAFKNNQFILDCAQEFGSQAVVVSIDCKKKLDKNIVFIEDGKFDTGVDVIEWIQKVESLGAGEILINSIDNDGVGLGFNEKLCKLAVEKTKIPVIICGGAGKADHFCNIYKKLKPHAMSAANIFQFTENSYQNIKTELKKEKLNIR